MPTEIFKINSDEDDAHEDGTGYLQVIGETFQIHSYPDSSSGFYKCAGLRFTNVTIPNGSIISNVKLRVHTPYGIHNINTDIYGQNTGDAEDFITDSRIIQRPRTSNSISVVQDNVEQFVWIEILGLQDIIQEIVNRPDWGSGNSLALLFIARTDIDKLIHLLSYGYGPEYAAELEITYEIPAPTHILSVSSLPIDGITFNISGGAIEEMSYVTPWSSSLEEGTYEIAMPSNIVVGNDTYNFVQWEDGTTNPIRTLNLISDLVIEATFQYIQPPPQKSYLEIHAFKDSTEVDASGIIEETGQTFQTGLTGIILEVDPSNYTISLTYEGITKQYMIAILEGETIRIDGQMTPPKPSIPLWIIAIPIIGLILFKWNKK